MINKKLHLISGPRNISTALMYSFGNRTDTSIVDEPFYAHYLKIFPEINHPGREETLQSQSSDVEQVLQKVIHGTYPTSQVFFKNMAHHLIEVDWSFLKDCTNIFLIRNPRQLIASFAQVIPHPNLQDIGLKLEYEILQYCLDNNLPFVVLDSNEVLKNPKLVLTKLCHQINIDFDEAMLSWTAGAREADGVWAKYWYANVHKSTGFSKQVTSERPFPKELLPLLTEAQEYYDLLCKYTIRAE